MQDPDNAARYYFRRIDPLRQNNPEDTELAFQLQNAPPNDPELLERLVYNYAADLHRWVGVLLYYRKMEEPSHEEILTVLKKVFGYSIKHAEQFHGKESISGWLFGIGYQIISRHTDKNWTINFLREADQGDKQDVLPPKPISAYWDSMDRLPEKLRSPLILRYLFDLGIPDIASIFNIQAKDIHRRLIVGRERLLANPIESHLNAQIQAYVDGLLDENPGELNILNQHLDTCDICQTSISKINSLEKTLAENIKARWVFSPLSSDDLKALVQSILVEITQPKLGWKLQLPLRQAAWTLGLALTFVGLAIIFIRMTPAEREFPQTATTPTQQLPPLIEISPSIAASQYSNEIPPAPEFIEPAFSSDGKWAVFASIKSIPNRLDRLLPTIEVYNREASTIKVISEGAGISDRLWVWWDLAPSISGDGRWIVYVSTTNDPNVNGKACETPDHKSCLDVFLYDRETGLTGRLTQSVNSGPADGDSLAPTVSGDGKWVAFWSTADNLVDGFTNTCQQGETSVTCLYVYLYNLETGKIERIQIPTIPGDPVFGVDRISLSADGRYVGFTITPTVQAGTPASDILPAPNSLDNSTGDTVMNTSIPRILQSSEAVVYDRETGKYELENQAQDGTPGNGESSSPVLSADGQYVAFTSASNNLVAEDTNNYSDVFLRDRQSGKLELISVSSAGWKGRSDSGLSFYSRGYYSLNISGDGRYVVFESTATSLGQGLNSGCDKIDTSQCNYLYVHDRQTGSTEWIAALPNQDFTFFPEISSDGRWVSFMQSFNNCSSSQFLCSNVMLYDRQNGWMTNLTKSGEESPQLPWSFSGSLSLPWETWESTALAFSLDGKLIALGGTDSKVRIWQVLEVDNSVSDAEPVAILKTEANDWLTALAFTPDGEWLAAGSSSGAVYLWNLSDGKLLYSLKDQSGLVKKLVFSQDGAHLVISTLYEAWIWSISDNQLINPNSFTYGETAAYAIDISPKGNMLATARGDGSIWLQSLPSGKVIGRLGASQLAADSLAFSKDGTLLATRSYEGTINIWQISAADSNTPSVTLLNTFRAYIYGGELAFSPDNKYLVSTGTVGEVLLWSVPDGKMLSLSTPVPSGMVNSLAFSKGGDTLAGVFENEIVLFGIPKERPSSYFVHAIADNYVDSQPTPEATANDIPFLQSPGNSIDIGNLKLDQAAQLVPFPLIVPAHLPENINFLDATVNFDGSVWLRYVTYHQQSYSSLLYIYEKNIGNSSPPTMTIGASAEVILTQIETASGRANAEYVGGDWLLSQGITPPAEGSLSGEVIDVWKWDNTFPSQRLRWQQNGLMIALYYQVNRPYTPVLSDPGQSDIIHVSSLLGQGELEQIASGMMPYSAVNASIPCVTSGQTETNPTQGVELTMSGQSCSSILQEKRDTINNGNMLR